MKTNSFDYNLPKNLIGNQPASPRDSSRLLVYDKKKEKLTHDKFFNLPKYLTENDVLVFNNSKVFPARLIGKKESGGQAEALLLKENKHGQWEALLGTRKPKIGLKLSFQRGLSAEVIGKVSEKTWLLEFNFKGPEFHAILDKIGQVPIPPYIRVRRDAYVSPGSKIKEKYQTVYAKELGSAAAPTAGLHFTNRLLNKIKDRGVQTEFVTLHVGLGTFDPVNTDDIENYKIHSEWVSVDKQTIKRLVEAKKAGRRIIAVGTTSVRTLEAIFNPVRRGAYASPDREFKAGVKDASPDREFKAGVKDASSDREFKAGFKSGIGVRRDDGVAPDSGFTDQVDIFIYPGYRFKFVDAMITNFHLPKSSLIMLVSAFLGRQKTLDLYKKAIKLKYRFFSFGDGMFLY
ncbi:tRNA preQ1(34) S-adenosylmethionine ribosyltransferase-isomerase QueA [Candidatus Kuenenbacteria bacterium]|nr:tRNA preQ1(34) S-adenosylmethionine ribosyltransferase-isomerase QueA [Candidatus Kuenenbacteria bacterium]